MLLFLTRVVTTKFLGRHRPKSHTAEADKENGIQKPKVSRLYAPDAQSSDRLHRPFRCPGAANHSRGSDKPARKRRKVNYQGADSSIDDADGNWTNEDRLALANRDANKFPIYKVKDKDTQFRQRFSVPLINKIAANYDPSRPAPTLGMRQGTIFIAKPLHDPSGEFAIVLYDPTVDDKTILPEEAEAADKPMVSLMHKSLAEILGLKKKVEDHPKIPVVIDPRLAKVLRPHQVEGVKVVARTHP